MSDHTSASDLVTGDAVVLELRLAQVPSRALSILLDMTAQLVLLGILLAVSSAATSSLDSAATAAITLVIVVGVIVGYPVAFETLSRGRTLGKLALGHRVVRDDGGPERFRQALIRGLFEFVEIWLTLGTIALFCSLFSQRAKRLGDQMAGTVVVRERMPARGGPVAAMPPPLAAWAASADLSRVPDALALQARGLIARGYDLDPATRSAMAVELATAIATFVAPPSPPGTPADAYLAAVLAERRRREQIRLGAPAPAPFAAMPYSAPVTMPVTMPAPTVPQPAVPPPTVPPIEPPTATPTDGSGGFAPPT